MDILIWIAAGLFGSVTTYLLHKLLLQENFCPTPRAILFGAIACALGPLTWVAALGLSVVGFILWAVGEYSTGSSWWTEPICNRWKNNRGKK